MKINELKFSPKGYRNEFPTLPPNLEGIIRKNCSQALNAYSNTREVLYRGVYDENYKKSTAELQSAFISSSLAKREALHTHKDIQLLIDSFFRKKGFKALRSNSIFCTAKKGDTNLYGFPYVIFPYNGFAFTWSSKISDLFLLFPSHSDNEAWVKNKYDMFKKMGADTFVKDYMFYNYNFPAALLSYNEILINGKYVAVACKEGEFLARLLPKVHFQ